MIRLQVGVEAVSVDRLWAGLLCVWFWRVGVSERSVGAGSDGGG